MIFVGLHRMAQAACQQAGKHGLWLSFPARYVCGLSDYFLAAPWLEGRQDSSLLQGFGDGHVLVLFDTAAERDAAYRNTVGDDGPTATNSYSGPCRIYALTISPAGELLNENT